MSPLILLDSPMGGSIPLPRGVTTNRTRQRGVSTTANTVPKAVAVILPLNGVCQMGGILILNKEL